MSRLAALLSSLFLASVLLTARPADAASPTEPLDPAAQQPPASRCMLIARDLERQGTPVRLASAQNDPRWAALDARSVRIRYAGHSTFLIETPQGVRIATDFSGVFGARPTPDVATMNHAHITHWTPRPDPAIPHVLKGWADPDGTPARHWLPVGDVLIRNVPTDIRQGDAMEIAGNSIFIFEVADLCIGHLGHLHHPLTQAHHAAIGRLDIVMVPIDGGLTLSTEAMVDLVENLQARIVLPMHRRFRPIEHFLARVRGNFDVRFEPDDTIDVSITSLPRAPTIIVLKGV